MRVLHINTNSCTGGAAIAAKRHCEAMRHAGIDAKMLCLYGKPNEYTLIDSRSAEAYKSKLCFARIRHYWNRLFVKKTAWHWLDADYDVTNIKEVQEADIIYLHWVNEYLSVNSIKSILGLGKPVVWYMHDMWPITGGCHHSFDCKGYTNDCSHCPQMKIFRNKTACVLKKKIESLTPFSNLYGAAPSNWLCELISESSVFNGHKVLHIPNVIDTEVYRPADKVAVRNELALPIDKKLIIFSAMGVDNPFKGVKYLVDTVERLCRENKDIEYLVVGKCDPNIFSDVARAKMHFTGYIDSQEKMIRYYNASDVLLTTSLADNFPNVVIEAMACGVPAVGFKTGGIVDQIHHKENGWIVPQKDVDGLVEGIKWVLFKANYPKLQQASRQYVEECCSYHNVLSIPQPALDLFT